MLYTNYFIEALKRYLPSDTVLFEGKQSITAGQLLDSAQQLATSLLENGVRKGDKVIIVVKTGIEFLQVMYANMMLGTIISIIDPEMGRENYLAKLEQFSPNHAFVDSKLVFLNEHPLLKCAVLQWNKSVPSFPKIKNCHLFTTGTALPLFQKHKHISSLTKNTMRSFTTGMIKEEEEFLITYTSGTLSEPKGVVHTYSSITNSIKHLTAILQSNEDKIIATHLPHYALLGINAGIKVHLWNNRMSAREKITFILKEKITTLFGPPSDFIPLIEYLKQHHEFFPKSLKNIYLGSAPIYNSFLSTLIPLAEQVKITCFYGMTENLMVTFQDGRDKMLEDIEGDLVGFPFPNVNISIAEDGEICIHSDQLYARYWQMEEIKSVHHTGDMGRMDEQGRLILMGRKKDMIIRGNFNIYPGLYEPTIHKIKGVKEAVMIGLYNHQKADEEVILVIDGEKGMTSQDVMKQLTFGAYSIDKEAIPDQIIFMDIPHSGRQNKVDRKLLASRLTALKK